MKTSFLNIWGLLGLAVAFAVCGRARGEQVTYVVDPARSSLTISGNQVTTSGSLLQIRELSYGGTLGNDSGGGDPSQQVYYSFTTSYAGTINVDRDIALNTQQITGGTVSANNSGNWPYGGFPANYGMVAGNGGRLGFVVFGAIKNFSFSPHSAPLGEASAFDAGLIDGTITSGNLEWSWTNFGELGEQTTTNGISAITGDFTLNAGYASLAFMENVETLSIPVEFDLRVPPSNSSPSPDFALHLSGEIVAVSSVPEPASVAALSLPAFVLLFRRKFVR